MAEVHDDVHGRFEGLAQIRDEIRVRLHLASKDTRDRFHELEEKLGHMQGRVGVAAGRSAENVGAAARLLYEELKAGYERIRRAL